MPRDDAPRKAEPGRLCEPLLHRRDRAHLARESHLADGKRLGVDRRVAVARCNGQNERQIRRRLIQVKPGDIQRAAQMFDVLLGDNLNGRKDYIAQHGSEYLDDLDVS